MRVSVRAWFVIDGVGGRDEAAPCWYDSQSGNNER
jgi:hypothetical protein